MTSRPRRGRVAKWVLASGLGQMLLACAASSIDQVPTQVDKEGLRIISGAGVQDTIQSTLATPLTVEVTVAGRRAGVVVRFEAPPDPDAARAPSSFWARLAKSGDVWQGTSAIVDTTDAAGRAEAWVQLGTVAGEVRIAVKVPEYGIVDTARVVTQPGNLSRIVHSPLDTALALSATYEMRATAADRFGNPRPEAITYEAFRNVAAITTSGMATAGGAIGRGAGIARVGALADTVWFTVVPPGMATFIYVAGGPSDSVQICSAMFDGRRSRVWRTLEAGGYVQYPARIPGTNLIVLSSIGPRRQPEIALLDSAGGTRVIVGESLDLFPRAPRVSADGAYIYFNALVPNYGYQTIFRVRSDGGALERVTNTVGEAEAESHSPAPSPDGSRFAFVEDQKSIVLKTVSTGARRVLAASGQYPVYSPDGRRIAFVNAGRFVVADLATGTLTPIGAPITATTAPPTAWSLDGEWFFASTYDGTMMTNATTGEQVVIPGTRGWTNLSLAP